MLRYKKMALFLAFTLTVSILAALVSYGAEEPPAPGQTDVQEEQPAAAGAGGELYAQNESLQLYVDTEDFYQITIKDISTGKEWTTTPEAYDADEIAQGSVKNEMRSQLIVTYCDDKKNTYVANSRVSSVNRGTAAIRKYKDGTGIQIEYDFSRESEQFKIPVRYQLVGSSLSVEILYDKIEEYGGKRILDITLLPYMMAGNKSEEGYLFIPDGSGMLVDFSSVKQYAGTYEKMIYGRDYSKNIVKQPDESRTIHLPVFGVKYQDSIITAIIEQGDYNASIAANPTGKFSNYANVYSKFIYRLTDTTVLADKEWNARDIFVVEDRPLSTNPKIRFCFQTGEDADYNDMAKVYRRYLMEEKGYTAMEQRQTAPALNLEIYGMTRIKESFLGFLIDRKMVLTHMEEVGSFLKELNEDGGLKINAVLNGFDKGGYEGTYDKKVSFDGAVGGNGGFRDLKKTAAALNTELFVAYDPMVVYRNAFFMFEFNHAAKTLDRRTAQFYKFRLSTGEKLSVDAYFLRPDKLLSYGRKYLASAEKAGVGIAFDSVGSILYTDFDAGHFSDRKQLADNITALLAEAGRDGLELLVDGGNGFAAGQAGRVGGAPTTSSGQDLESVSIPFYQIVLHGLAELSGDSLNFAPDPETEFLRRLQTGTELKYSYIANSDYRLRETSLNFLYNCSASAAEQIREQQEAFNRVHTKLQHVIIDRYQMLGNVSKTTYENGTVIYVNFGDQEEIVDGITVPAKGYQIND